MDIQLPYINLQAHLKAMMHRYDRYADRYNELMNRKREEDPANRQAYQTLKPTHRALFRDIVMETAAGMLHDLHLHDQVMREQGNAGLAPLLAVRNPLCGDGFFVCHTNRSKLSARNRKEETTIYRNIHRLAQAGIITAKVGHGKKADFELHIHEHFLVVSDRRRPGWDPMDEAGTADAQSAFCKVEENIIEQLKHTIHSAYAVDKDGFPAGNDTEGSNATGETGAESPAGPDGGNTLQGGNGRNRPEQRECRASVTTPDGTLQGREGEPGGAAGRDELLETSRRLTDELRHVYGRAYTKNPTWHALQRTLFAQLFVDYVIEKLYTPRGAVIYPEARGVAIDYAERWYFPTPFLKTGYKQLQHCTTEADYTTRLSMLMWCVDAARRYTARRKGYFPMPCKYLDLDNPAGFAATFGWWERHRQNEADKRRARRHRQEIDNLRQWVLHVLHHPDRATYEQALDYVRRRLPRYEWRFVRSVAHIINRRPEATSDK